MAGASCRRNSWFPLPFALIGNGDIWRLFFEVVAARGHHSFMASWGKGHTTQKHIRDGVTTKERAEGNRKAHMACDQARELASTSSAASALEAM